MIVEPRCRRAFSLEPLALSRVPKAKRRIVAAVAPPEVRLTIRLNGEPLELAAPVTISALLAQLQVDPRLVAVEHNIAVVKRALYDTTEVRDGDEVEIVRFVGGG